MPKLPSEWHERTAPEETTAAWQSRCGYCDEVIEIGDPISLLEGEWVHKECKERDGD